MEDHRHTFEKRALANTRALIDKLERSQPQDMPLRSAAAFVGSVALTLLIVGALTWYVVRERDVRKCVVGERMFAIEAEKTRLRRDWGRTPTEIDAYLKAEDSKLSERARLACEARVKGR